MTSSERLLPLLPLLVPFVGAALAWALPPVRVTSLVRRWICALTLTGACAALIVTRQPDGIVSLPALRELWLGQQAIEFSLDSTAFSFALLLHGTLAFAGISSLTRPMARSRATSLLVLAGATVAACHAANLPTLCLSWGLMDLALLGLEFIRAPEERTRHAVRRTAVSLISTLLLIGAAVFATSELEPARLPQLAQAPLARGLLVLAAILRLGSYPLPGNANRRWETYLTALCSGGSLWLRMASLSPPGSLGAGWLVPLGAGALLATGALAGLAPDLAAALPYMLLHGFAILIIAPALGPATGVAVAFMTVVNLTVCLVLLRVDAQVRPARPLRRWTRFPLMVALASLAGWPPTLGFASRWAFLKLCFTGGFRGVFVLGTVSSLLSSVPVWHRYQQVRREIVEKGLPDRRFWIAIVCAFVMAAVLAAVGFHPPLLTHIWPAGTAEPFPSLARLFAKDTRLLWPLLLSGILVPPLGSYLLAKMQAIARNGRSPGRAVGAVLELDWLYLGIQKGLGVSQSLAERALEMIEEPFSLVWTLVWGLAAALYLLGR